MTSRPFPNSVNCYTDFVEDKFQFDSVVLSDIEEYKVRGKGNVLFLLRGKKVMIKDVYYVHCLEKNPLSISSLMKHSTHLHIKFQ